MDRENSVVAAPLHAPRSRSKSIQETVTVGLPCRQSQPCWDSVYRKVSCDLLQQRRLLVLLYIFLQQL